MCRKSHDISPKPLSIAEQIAECEIKLMELRQQERAELVAAIATTVGPGVVFSARELWDHRLVSPELSAAFTAAGITSPRRLGKRLRQLCGSGLKRVDEDLHGALWECSHTPIDTVAIARPLA